MNKSLIALAITSLFGSAALAAGAPSVATNFSLTSNYKFRGQDQGENKPAVQGGFDYANGGFYLGNWDSSVKQGTSLGDPVGNGSIEMDFYGGYKGDMSGVGYDIGLLEYYYPQKNKSVDIDTTEIYGALSYGIGSLKYSRTISSKYFGVTNGKGTGYWDLSANYEITKGLTLNGHLGATQYSGGGKVAGGVNYSDYKIGLTYDLGSGFSLGGAAVGATKKDIYGDINKGRFIVTLTKTM